MICSVCKKNTSRRAEMPPNVAARHIGNFIGSLAVDALLGKGIGTAIGSLRGLKIGAKIITETVELSKKLKQTLGKIPVPTLESKILDLKPGVKISMPGLEVKKLLLMN